MAGVKKIILSQNFDLLAECLSAALQDQPKKLQKQWVFVPSISLKQWLLTQLARFSPTGGIAGCKICTLDEWIHSRFPQIPTSLEMRCLIYHALSIESAPEVVSFLSLIHILKQVFRVSHLESKTGVGTRVFRLVC